jgi:hypothetical protein
MNARFWIYWNGGLVKITMARGDSFELYRSEPTDEGYHSEWERYEFDGERVSREMETHGRDCDGSHSTRSVESARLDKLAVVWNKYVEAFYPEWEEDRPTRVYDQFAQAMGY